MHDSAWQVGLHERAQLFWQTSFICYDVLWPIWFWFDMDLLGRIILEEMEIVVYFNSYVAMHNVLF